MKLIPTVILTSSREERDILEGYSLGVNAYVVKPVEFESFTKAMSVGSGILLGNCERSPHRIVLDP